MTKRAQNTTTEGALACAFGEPFAGPHHLCEAESERLCAIFAADVAAGKYDADGYSRLERAAQRRREALRQQADKAGTR